jgi:hypothetical protein
LVALDDAVELSYDELSRNFFGIPWSGSRTADRPLTDRELENLDYARTLMLFVEAQATRSIDQRFPPGTLPED